MSTWTSVVLVAVALTAGIDGAEAAGRLQAQGMRSNAEGGISAGRVHGARGAQGGAALRAGRVRSDGAGNVRGGSAGAVRGPNGGAAARAGQFRRDADGSWDRRGGMAAAGPNGGRLVSTGSASGDGQGQAAATRVTQATGAQGNTYEGETTAVRGEGVTHTHSCTNAAGEAIACRRD